MRRVLITASLIAGVALKSVATLPVIDYTHIAQDAGNEVVNLAKWTASELHEAQTDLNTLNSYEETVLQVERMGDPKTLVANIPGVSNLQTLSQIYQQGEQDINDWASFVNPKSWQLTEQEILDIYGQPGFNGFTSNGIHLGAAQSLFQFQVSNYNTDQSAKTTVDRLTQQLKTLTQQLSVATSKMQSATTESEVQKYHASIAGIQSGINATSAALEMAKFSERLQTQQNSTAQTISHISQVQQTAAEDLQAIDVGLSNLPVGQMSTPILWNSQP